MMKILITGSSGYVGRVLSRYFTMAGVYVTGVDCHGDGYLKDDPYFEFRRGSVTDRNFLRSVFSETSPTHVIHLAYSMIPLHDRHMEYSIDVTGSMNTLVCSNESTSVRQIVLMSSASAYGAWPDNPLWIKEESPLMPKDYRYGIYKKKIEECYSRFQARKNLHVVILRMCTAIGPSYHKKGGVVSLLAGSPLLPRFDNTFCRLQFIHEYDLCALMDLVLHDDRISGRYNLAPDSYSSVDELAPGSIFMCIPLKAARAAAAVLWKLRLSSCMPAAMDLATYGIVIDPAKIMKRYGYTFRYSTSDGFLDTVRERKKLGTL